MLTRIQARRGLIPLHLHEVWEYRELVFFFLWRDIKGKYRQTAFGPLWMIVTPIINMVLYTIIFGKVAKLSSEGIPYQLFNYSALLPWSFFSSALFNTANSLLTYRTLISKVYFPRLIIPIVGTVSGFVDFLLSFVILLAMAVHYGYPPGVNALALPLFLLLAAMTGIGVGLWWASWIVHYRDLANVLTYVAKFWMYASPVVYSISLIPEHWRTLYRLNPMVNTVEGFRWALLGIGQPDWRMVGYSFALVSLLLVGGAYHFRRTERSIVDIA